MVSINMDQGGYSVLLDSHELSEGEFEMRQVEQNQAHHGVVVPWGDNWLVSVADAPDETGKAHRIGVRTLNADGEPNSEMVKCSNLHGESFSGNYLALGCKEGVLTVKESRNGPEYKMLAYPDSFPEGEMTGHFIGAQSYQAFLGSYGKKGMVVIDPADAPQLQLIELPFRRVDFTLDPVQIQNGYVLTEDGTLHKIDMMDADITQSAKVTQPYSMEGHWNDPRPRLAMAGDEILLTDPKAGVIRRISTETLKEVGMIEVDGMPYNMTVVGGSGVSH